MKNQPTKYVYTTSLRHGVRRRDIRQAPLLPPKPRFHLPRGKTLTVLLLALFGFGIYGTNVVHVRQVHAKEVAAVEAARQLRIAALPEKIQAITSSLSGVQFGVSILSENGKEQLSGNSSAVEAASTAKVLTAVAYLHQVESGKASLTDYIGSYTATSRLEAMIVQSDDPSWEALNDKLGNTTLAAYATHIGITDYDVVNNYLSPHDLSVLLLRLHEGRLLNTTHTAQLLNWLQAANYRNYIVEAVPSTDSVYHKIGLVDDTVNDVALISNGTSTVALSIFTNGNGIYNWPDRAAAIQQITRAVVSAYL